jgi:hypothetical protein
MYTRMVLVLVLLVPSAFSQQINTQAAGPDNLHWNTRVIPLTFDGSAKRTDVRTSGLTGNYDCDDSGAIYARLDTPGDVLKQPVVRISASDPQVTFNLPSSEFPDLDVYIFASAVDPGGRVYELARLNRDEADASSTYLLIFDKDGHFRRKTKLQTDFRPEGLVALADGKFLATGTIEDKGKPVGTLTAIFNDDGSLLTQLKNLSPSHSPNSKMLELGHIRVGDDKNIYVLRIVDPARVDIYTQPGVLVRSLKLPPPFDNALARDLYVSGYRVIVEYGHVVAKGETPDGRLYLTVYNGETGELMNAYSQMSKGIIACIRNGEVTVLTPEKDKHFGILTASLP